jgi:hypothetical protein
MTKVTFHCVRCGHTANSQAAIEKHAADKRENGVLATVEVQHDDKQG